MATVDHATIHEWLHRELDGDLLQDEQTTLAHHLDQCADCRTERQELRGLDRLLADGPVSVREGFQEEVLSALPPVAWEARARRAWRLPLALMAALILASVGLFRVASGSIGGSVFGIVTAVADLFGVALVTGAGLLGHSWQGLRLAFGEVLGGSATGILGLVALVAGLNALLFFALRRRSSRPATESAGARKGRD